MQGLRQEIGEYRRLSKDHQELENLVEELENHTEKLELKLDMIEDELGIEFDLEPLDDSEELDEEDQPRKRRSRSKYRLRKGPLKSVRRHQNARRPGRREKTKEQKPQPKREHGKIIDRGRF